MLAKPYAVSGMRNKQSMADCSGGMSIRQWNCLPSWATRAA